MPNSRLIVARPAVSGEFYEIKIANFAHTLCGFSQPFIT
jgi:hypothetical protein